MIPFLAGLILGSIATYIFLFWIALHSIDTVPDP